MNNEILREALTALLNHYTSLVNSGDAGNWDPESEPVVIDARTALASQPQPEAAEPAAWQVWWGVTDKRPHWPPFKTKAEAEEVAASIKSTTEVRPLYTHAQQHSAAGGGEARLSREEARRYSDPGFQQWLDDSITENAEFTVWDTLKNVHDAYSGWCARPYYAPQAEPVSPTSAGEVLTEALREQAWRAYKARFNLTDGDDMQWRAWMEACDFCAAALAHPAAPAQPRGITLEQAEERTDDALAEAFAAPAQPDNSLTVSLVRETVKAARNPEAWMAWLRVEGLLRQPAAPAQAPAGEARDAARYRCLRATREAQTTDGTIIDVYDEDGAMLTHESLDSAVDAIMAATPAAEGGAA